MNKHRLVGIATLAFLSGTTLVGANEQPDGWLRWNDDARGHPAITLNATTGIHVAMPEGMIAEAIALGKTKEQAVTAFLDRYAPGMCTDMADMSVAHDRLTVHVHMQKQDDRFLPARMFVMDDAAQDFHRHLCARQPGALHRPGQRAHVMTEATRIKGTGPS